MMTQSDNSARTSRVAALAVAASVFLGGCFSDGSGDSVATTQQAGAGTTIADSTTPDPQGNDTDTIVPAQTTTPPAATTSGKTAVLVWQPPATNEDGSALVDLQGYHVYMGSSATSLARVGSADANLTSYTVGNLSAGTYYFAVSAYNQAGAESAMSNTASKTISN